MTGTRGRRSPAPRGPGRHSDSFRDFVLDQLAGLEALSCRPMFGGFGLSCRGSFFGALHKGRLYFKTDEASRTRYRQMGMTPFRPNATQTLLSYYEVPVEVVEDPEQLRAWAEDAIRVGNGTTGGRRAAAARRRR